jgi:hypothetical protein
MPQISVPLALTGCFGLCAGYAALLLTKWGQEFNIRHTWATVVIGVLIVLLCMATVDSNAALLTLTFFVAGGTPMLLRTLLLSERHQRERIQYWREKRGE